MRNCVTCYAWRPHQWEGWRYADNKAFCVVWERDTVRSEGETCDHHSIVKPANIAKRATVARAATFAEEKVEDVLADWYKEHESEFDFITKGSSDEKQMFKHQQEDIDRHSASSEIMLFNEMGTGKSATMIRIICEKYLRGEIETVLVVAPNGVHKQWAVEEIPKWILPEVKFEVQCFGGRGGAKTTRPFSNDSRLKILCTNIDTFSTPKKWVEIAEWVNATKSMIVLDEATSIKSMKSKRTERMLYAFNTVVRKNKQLISSKPNTVARAVLTGTPVTNGPLDLWCIAEFIRPNFFGRNWYSFQNYYAMHTTIDVTSVDDKGNTKHNSIAVLLNEEKWEQIKEITSFGEANAVFGVTLDTFNTIHSQTAFQGPYKHAEELRKMLEPVASFRLLKDCVDMPPQNYTRRIVQMTDEIATCYYDMEEELLAEYETRISTAKSKLTAIIRLQQISSGFLSTIVDELDENGDLLPNDITWIGKSNAKLDKIYEDVAESKKPVIIVTHFTAEAARIYDDLKGKYRVSLITGWKRVGSIEDFKNGKYDVMVANIRAASRGFNLQNSYSMFFYSNTFSLEDRLQMEGRIWRIGQERPCQYIDYVHEDTVDMKIVGALRQKRSLLDYIRGVDTKSFLREQDEVFQIEYAEVYK
jgi:SNF2 family DNA or RNA helicase